MLSPSNNSSKSAQYLAKHQHGGQLQSASRKYGIPVEDWLDLSTGISPISYPLPSVPESVWQRLPEINDGLESVSQAYYGSSFILPVSGSQEAIQSLPEILASPDKRALKVGIIKPAYHSHQEAWMKEGCKVIGLATSEVEAAIDKLDVLIVVNPTNPSCEKFSIETLKKWHQGLQKHQGTLLVDEAFMDATSEGSLITEEPEEGLIVLRSVGKFFGLAGIRLGFVWAEAKILASLANAQDDWSVSNPARWAGKTALADTDWQAKQRLILKRSSERLRSLLEASFFSSPLVKEEMQRNVVSTNLFSYLEHQDAEVIYQQLAQQGILVRLFDEQSALRFGLPADEPDWELLKKALLKLST